MGLVFKARRPDGPEDLPLTAAEREIARRVQTAASDLETAAMSNAVKNAIAARNMEQVVQSFPWDDATSVLHDSAQTFGNAITDSIGKGFPKLAFAGRFDYTDPRAIEWAKNQAATLVTNMNEQWQARVREVIARSFTNNITVANTAKELASFINMTERQAYIHDKFRQSVMTRYNSKQLTQPQALKLLENHKKKLLKQRSIVIARQEIAMAEANGRYLGFTQAVDNGWASKNAMKRWSASSDERTCSICGPMHGKSVKWNEPFPNGVMREPAHIQCRCTTSLLEPDSKLAQDFMEPVKIVPPTINTPMPILPTVPITGLRSPEEAVEDAHTRASGISNFQYDAGEIEDLNVHTESVIFNGSPHTELRFKLTEKAKWRLIKRADKDINNGATTWGKLDGALIDKKTGKAIEFRNVTHDEWRGMRSIDREPIAAFSSQGTTYTAYLPDGTSIRFIRGSKDSFALDGSVRIMIPGKATPTAIKDAMKEIGVTARRMPSPKDVNALRDSKVIALFRQEFKSNTDPLIRAALVRDIEKEWNFSFDDITTQLSPEGKLRFIFPQQLMDSIASQTRATHLKHSFNGFAENLRGQERIDGIANFLKTGRLLSTTERYNRGISGHGMSEWTDIKTGGADYVFFSPVKGAKGKEYISESYSMTFKTENVLNRSDWFAYSSDSYGVKNPSAKHYYQGSTRGVDEFDKADYLKELSISDASGEVMVQSSVDFMNVDKIFLGGESRDEVILKLKQSGMLQWFDGRELEDVIVLGRESR